MANFDPQLILKNIRKNSEYGVIGFLALVAMVMFIFLSKKPDFPIPTPTTIDISTLAFPKESAAEIKRSVDELVSLDQSNYKNDLLQRNLFSFRDVLSKQALEKEINDKLKRAETLFEQGSYQSTLDLCNEILQSDPNLERAKSLKDKAQKAILGVSTLTTITTSTTK